MARISRVISTQVTQERTISVLRCDFDGVEVEAPNFKLFRGWDAVPGWSHQYIIPVPSTDPEVPTPPVRRLDFHTLDCAKSYWATADTSGPIGTPANASLIG